MSRRSPRSIGAWGGLLALAFAIPAPCLGQQIDLDVNADGVSDGRDVLGPWVRSVDIYLTSDRGAEGRPAPCAQDSALGLGVSGYSLVLRSWGEGSVGFRSWIPGPDVSILTTEIAAFGRGSDFYVAYVGLTPLAPGRYRLGTLLIEVTGYPRLSFATSSEMGPELHTSFASPCPGENYGNVIRLGGDFDDAHGTAPGPPRVETAWEAIQLLYH